MVLALMLVLVALTSLLATAGLERTQHYRLLITASADHTQRHQILDTVLAQALAYAQQQLRLEDLYTNQKGLYSEVQPNRLQHKHFRQVFGVGENQAGFLIELWSCSELPFSYQSQYYLACRLQISAQVATTDGYRLAKQSLLDTVLPTNSLNSTNTQPAATLLPPAKIVATRIVYQ